jgi:hypothetical protein
LFSTCIYINILKTPYILPKQRGIKGELNTI